ncbi:MAG: AAA family ATPase [Myxococcales bacterium]|nr:AAA family ATPase [Myxococcales bacterium]
MASWHDYPATAQLNPDVITLPSPCLVLLIGLSGAGKSTFAARHFRATEVVSSDTCRALVRDDEADQRATTDAFEVVHLLTKLRLRAHRTTVIDATNLKRADRAHLLKLAQSAAVPAAAIVLDLPRALCHERNQRRQGRDFGPDVLEAQEARLRSDLRSLSEDGLEPIVILDSVAAIDSSRVGRATSSIGDASSGSPSESRPT